VRSAPKLVLAAVIAAAPLVGGAQESPPVAAGEMPTREEVEKALDEIASDPNLAAERAFNTLRWKRAEPVTEEPSWWAWANAIVRWFRGLLGWIGESARLLVWVLLGIAAALLAVFVVKLVRAGGIPRLPQQFTAPSHVRDLDIRPESLPDDVGAAALALWQRGEQRAALALLYRGTLSRLVHVHAVPIRASSTEGECLALARPRLMQPSALYVERLIDVWAAAVYGAREPRAGAVEALCSEFAAALGAGSAA
jgi:hypothetical protein